MTAKSLPEELVSELSRLEQLGMLYMATELLRKLRVETEKNRQWMEIGHLREFVRGSRPDTPDALVEKAWEYLVDHDGTQAADTESGKYVYGGDPEVVPANCKLWLEDVLYVVGQCYQLDRIYPLPPDSDVKELLRDWATSR